MGVPVVTLVGETAPSRAGLSILTAAGLPQFIAHSPHEFLEIAARNHTTSRPEIRRQLQASSLMNHPQFAANVESAYRQTWKTFVNS
jgi:predicted O-linked N-acetylglucosamine transferase (SPINDLY family)